MKEGSTTSFTPLKKTENRIQAKKNARIIPIQSISDHPNAEILRSVHVSRLIECRAFEIEKLTEALNKSEIMSKARAFQKVPRYLRRRAASHNPKKVPRKYRKQAEHELSLANSKLKKKTPLELKKELKKRRLAFRKLKRRILRLKTTHWIPTHVWHAKRFHMLPIWDLKIPNTPTQKCARAFYRASQHGSVCFDQSYMKIYACQSQQRSLLLDLFASFAPQLHWSNTTRVCEGWIRKDVNQTLIAPVTFLWMEETLLWMIVHPLAESDVLDVLSHKLKETSNVVEIKLEEVTQVGFLSLYGPRALGLLQSVLNLDPTNETSTNAATLWQQLKGVLDPATLPSGITLELQIWDPRLSYPPSRPNYTCCIEAQKQSQVVLEQPWPKLTCTHHKVINQPLRKLAWSKLHTRRSQLSIPGTPLSPDSTLDTSFPLFLWTSPIPSSSSSFPSSVFSSSSIGQGEGGLHLLLPRKFTLPLWRSLVYAGARPGGLTQLRAFHLPLKPLYPFDYPETRAYQLHHQPLAHQKLQRWNRTPSAKRINYSALGIEHPFLPDWKHFVTSTSTTTVTPATPRVWVRVQLLIESGIAEEHAVVFKDETKTHQVGYVTTGKYVFQQGKCVAWAVVHQPKNSSTYLSLGSKLYVQTPSRPVVYTAKILKIHP